MLSIPKNIYAFDFKLVKKNENESFNRNLLMVNRDGKQYLTITSPESLHI